MQDRLDHAALAARFRRAKRAKVLDMDAWIAAICFNTVEGKKFRAQTGRASPELQ